MMTVCDEISKTFNKHAQEYEYSAKAQFEIGQRLLERLQYLNMKPRYVLDLGSGPGSFSGELVKRYPDAHIIAVDRAQTMLIEARKKQGWRRKWSLACADMMHLPFATGLFDLVFANQVIHWSPSLAMLFREINRIMNVNGCFMFTTLGPDTFKELKMSWIGVNTYAHVNEFIDMHDVGDTLMTEYFVDPVMDTEYLSLHYSSLSQLMSSLKAQGVRNINPQRHRGLTGRTAWNHFEHNYQQLRTEQGKYPLSYEVVYGHAWKGEQRKTAQGTETMIPISQINKINR